MEVGVHGEMQDSLDADNVPPFEGGKTFAGT